jgi:flagellar biosynthesis/type III secretory pathway protein FliH
MSSRRTFRIPFSRPPKAFRLAGGSPARPAAGPAGTAARPGSPPLGVEAELRARSAAQARELEVLASLTAALRRETERLATLRAEITRDLGRRLLDVAAAVCESVLGERVERGDYRVASLLRPALDTLASHGVRSADVTIRLHPADRVSLEAAGDVPSLGPGIALVEDESVARASCVIETPVGSVVSDVDEAFREAIARLRAGAEALP